MNFSQNSEGKARPEPSKKGEQDNAYQAKSPNEKKIRKFQNLSAFEVSKEKLVRAVRKEKAKAKYQDLM